MYNVDHSTWANFATMRFIGNAALWLQTYEAEHDVDSWEELCVAMYAKFGKDKHHRSLEALERCKQTESVEAYFNKFETLRHTVLVHNKHYDEAFCVTKFVGGLRKDIQRAIRLHKPRTVDVALSLAETQEELLEETRHFTSSRHSREYKQQYHRQHYSGKGILAANPDDKRAQEDKNLSKPVWSEKFQSLKAQRRSRGEYFKYGDKFQPGDKCSKSVPLHLVEELVELLQVHSSCSDKEHDSSTSSEESLMLISECAMADTTKRESMRL